MNMMAFADAPQRALRFLIQQASYIEPIVYRTQYRDIQYPALIPVDRSAPPWTKSVTYFSLDAVGQAQWFNGRAQDVPNAELLREKFETTVSMAAIGYRYDLEELADAQALGINLTTDKADMARRGSEEFIEKVAFFGDASKGMSGALNNAAVTAGLAAATGAAGATTFASKTPDNVLADFNSGLTGIFTGTAGVEMADTVLLPYNQLLDINTRRIDAVNQTTILEWVMKNNIYTRLTGQELMVRGVFGLETAGAGGVPRMVFYRRDPSVLKFHMPMPFQFLEAWRVGPIVYEVPGIFRLGGVDIKRPKSIRYMDGI